MEIAMLRRASQSLLSDEVQSDLLVSKSTKSLTSNKYTNEVIAFTMYGWKSVIKKYARRGERIEIKHRPAPHLGYNTYLIRNTDDFEIKEETKGDFMKLEFTRNIREVAEGEVQQFYPILATTSFDPEEQKSDVYSMVKRHVSTPMLPNMEHYQVLAAQMFISKEEAKQLLDILQGKPVKGVNMDLNVFQYGKFLYETYPKWKNHLYQEMQKMGLISPLEVVYSKDPLQMFEVIIEEDIIENIIVEGVRSGVLTFTRTPEQQTSSIEDFNEYMSYFAPAMAQRIESLAKPIHRKGDIPLSTHEVFQKMKRQPLSAQSDAIEACVKAMTLKGKVNLIGECGVGSAKRSAITAA